MRSCFGSSEIDPRSPCFLCRDAQLWAMPESHPRCIAHHNQCHNNPIKSVKIPWSNENIFWSFWWLHLGRLSQGDQSPLQPHPSRRHQLLRSLFSRATNWPEARATQHRRSQLRAPGVDDHWRAMKKLASYQLASDQAFSNSVASNNRCGNAGGLAQDPWVLHLPTFQNVYEYWWAWAVHTR